MVQKIKQLIELQLCDVRIREVEKKRQQGPERIRKLTEKLKKSEKGFQDQQDRLDACMRERRDMEGEVEDLEARIGKSNAKLSAVASNREYKAALKEVEDLKRGKSAAEDQILSVMEEVDQLTVTCEEERKKQQELSEKVKAECREIEVETASLDKVIQDLESERARLSEGIDPELLNRYSFLIDRKDGLALSPVIKGVCQSCHMDIPPQRFNEVIRGDRLITCPHCNRIIYWGEDERYMSAAEEGETPDKG